MGHPPLGTAFALALGALGSIVLTPSPAAAVLVRRSASEFFAAAKTIERLRVVKLDRGRLRATVLESLRGPARRGATLEVSGPMTELQPGAEVLRVCSARFCIWGLARGDKHGYFEVHTDFYGHATVHIPPGLVERRALPLLAAGKTPPELCATLTVRFSDEPQSAAHFTLTLRTGTGVGQLAAAPAAAGSLARTLLPSPGRMQLFVREGRTSVTVTRPGGAQVTLSAGLPTRQGNAGLPTRQGSRGCYALNAWASWPFARTARLLRRALAGKAQAFTLARGTLLLREPVPGRKLGPYPLRVTFSPDHGLRFVCALLKDPAPHQGYSKLAARMLSFPTTPAGRHLGLVSGFARSPALARRLATELRAHDKLRWPVRLHGVNDEGALVGEATLRHVADPR